VNGARLLFLGGCASYGTFPATLFGPFPRVKPALFLRYFCVIFRPACVSPGAEGSWDRALTERPGKSFRSGFC
jgi:hypothetical protein